MTMNETPQMLDSEPVTTAPGNSKMLLIGGGVVLALIIMIVGVVAYTKFSKPAAPVTQVVQKKKVLAPENVIAVSDRPYVQIIPTDIHDIQIKINSIKKAATSADYEIEYQTDSSLEGAQGLIDLKTIPNTADLLLGTRSAGGATRYHTGVLGGSMTLTFNGSENYTLKQEWSFLENPAKGTQFSSKDAKFQVDSKDMSSQKVVIIYNSPGYPGTLPGTALSDPYTMSASSPLTGKANLMMRAAEAAPTAEIVGWNGTKWVEFSSKVSDKTVTATVDLLPLYMIIKK